MGKFVLAALSVAIFVYALFDLVATPRERVRWIPKPLWFVVLLVVGIGPLVWLLLGKSRPATPPPPQRPSGGWTPPPKPRGPDDDPDYLRGL